MQLRNGLDRHATGRLIPDDGETALIRGNRLFDPAGGAMLQPGAELLLGARVGGFGVRERGS
jgi:hypothetical protein